MPILQVRRCRHVEAGAPVLRAARAAVDAPGEPEWRVGCGACAEEDGERAALEQVIRQDPSLVEVVLRPSGTVLSRRAPGERWRTDEGPVPLPHRASRHWPSFDPRYPPRTGEPLDEGDLTLLAAVGRRGWHTVLIAPDEGEPGYGFTVGLFRRFDHPEVALFGVAPEALRTALDRVGERIAGGERFDSGDVVEGLLERRAVTLRRIAPAALPRVPRLRGLVPRGRALPGAPVRLGRSGGALPLGRLVPARGPRPPAGALRGRAGLSAHSCRARSWRTLRLP